MYSKNNSYEVVIFLSGYEVHFLKCQVPLGKSMLTLLKYCSFGKLEFKVNTKVALILGKAALGVEEKKHGFVGFRV